MIHDTINLINETITRDTLTREIISETKTQVYAEVSSVSMSEWFEAGRNGLQADLRFKVFFGDYSGQRTIEYNSARYGVYRTFRSGDYMELYTEKKAGE